MASDFSGGSAKGDRASTGECTEVASAKRGVRGPGTLREPSEEDESEVPVRAGVRFKAAGRLFSSEPEDLVSLADSFEGCETQSDGPCPGMVGCVFVYVYMCVCVFAW